MARRSLDNPSPATLRQRRYRERQRQQSASVRVELDRDTLVAIEGADPVLDSMDRDHPDYERRRQQVVEGLVREFAQSLLHVAEDA